MAGTGSFPISITWQVANANVPLQSINKVQGAIGGLQGKAQSSFGAIQNGAQQTTGSMNRLSQGISPLNQNMATLQQRSQQVAGSQGQLGNAFRQTGTGVQNTAGSLGQYNTSLNNSNQQTQGLRQRLGGLGNSFTGLSGSMTGAVASSTLLFTSFGGLESASIRFEDAQITLAERLTITATRQKRVSDLERQGKKNTADYENAVGLLNLSLQKQELRQSS